MPHICRRSKLKTVKSNINSENYVEKHIRPVIAIFSQNRSYTFREDNPHVYTSRETVNWKQENDNLCMNWPPQPQDINIIENIWKTLKIKL